MLIKWNDFMYNEQEAFFPASWFIKKEKTFFEKPVDFLLISYYNKKCPKGTVKVIHKFYRNLYHKRLSSSAG